MFTGIVEELGEVVALERQGDSARLTVRGPVVTGDTRHGASIAVNGCCLTVVDVAGGAFTADVMRESLDKTSLGGLEAGSLVNLERAVLASDRLSGHVVQGHVDGVATITQRTHTEHWDVVTVAVSSDLARYIALKGSIAIDGVSLTVSDVDESTVSVSLIPTTLARTTLGHASVGDVVNLEVDVIAKYVERLLAFGAALTPPPRSPATLGKDG